MPDPVDFKTEIKERITSKARNEIKDFISEYWVIVGGANAPQPDEKTLDNYADQLMKNKKIVDTDGKEIFDLNNFQAKAQSIGITDLGALGKVEDLKNMVPSDEDIEKLAAAAEKGYKKSTDNWFSFEGIGNFFSALMSYIGDFFEWVFSGGKSEFPGNFVSYLTAAGAPGVANHIATEINAETGVSTSVRQKVIDGVHDMANHMANHHGEMPKEVPYEIKKPLSPEDLKVRFVDDLVSKKVDEAFNTPDKKSGTTKIQDMKAGIFNGIAGLSDQEIKDVTDVTKKVLSAAVMDKDFPKDDANKAKEYIQGKLKEELGKLSEKYAWKGSKKWLDNTYVGNAATFVDSYMPEFIKKNVVNTKVENFADTLSEKIANGLGDKNLDIISGANGVFNKENSPSTTDSVAMVDAANKFHDKSYPTPKGPAAEYFAPPGSPIVGGERSLTA